MSLQLAFIWTSSQTYRSLSTADIPLHKCAPAKTAHPYFRHAVYWWHHEIQYAHISSFKLTKFVEEERRHFAHLDNLGNVVIRADGRDSVEGITTSAGSSQSSLNNRDVIVVTGYGNDLSSEKRFTFLRRFIRDQILDGTEAETKPVTTSFNIAARCCCKLFNTELLGIHIHTSARKLHSQYTVLPISGLSPSIIFHQVPKTRYVLTTQFTWVIICD